MPRIRTLSDRDLTLSFLARQLLLVRRRMPAHVAVRRLGALQAQYSPSPYVALHSRLEGFRTTGLEAAITRGSVIKATLMRGTLHLVHRRDYPAYAAAWHRQAWARPSGAQQGPPEPELAAELVAFSAKPRSTDEIRDRVRRLTGGAVGEADLLNYARMLVPFLHVPPSGLWRRHGKFAVVAYTGGLPAEPTATALVVRRYLAAFGPATREDIAHFTSFRLRDIDAGLASLEEVRRCTDERGRELLDLSRAPMPMPDTAIPVRLLARWDAALLSHRDRTRILPTAHESHVIKRSNGDFLPTYLVDGLVAGTWSYTATSAHAVLTLRPLGHDPRCLPAGLESEAVRMLRFLAPDSGQRCIEIAESVPAHIGERVADHKYAG